MSESRALVPSLAHAQLPDMRNGPGFAIQSSTPARSRRASPVCFSALPERWRGRSGHGEPQVSGDVV
jgi:hypothetical protein